MAKEPADKFVRRNFTWPPSFEAKLTKLRERMPGKTGSEILREGVALLDACSNPDAIIIMRDKDGKDTELKVV